MDERARFLRAIVERPGDMALRLVFADWLDEHGEADRLRAEFIRLQCEADKPWSEQSGECWQCRCARTGRQRTNGPCRCTQQWKACRSRESELLNSHWTEWLNGMPDILYHETPDKYWRGGFVAQVGCRSMDWLAQGTAIVLAQPILDVQLVDLRPSETRRGWSFAEEGTLSVNPQSLVPRPIWRFMRHVDQAASYQDVWPAREHALAVLSAGARNWARDAAGLPGLPPAVTQLL